jgi:anion-transporting  ArsA/GET3 family ATPase
VLGIEVDAKGDLAAALGAKGASSKPEAVQQRISVLALHPEESLQEYLRIYFKVPRFARMTPLARVFDFIATAVPGPRDLLVVGKIAFEERRKDRDRPAWDLIVVDCSASGHIVSQLRAARSMMELVRGGVIRNQVEWIDRVISDPRRTAVALTALPEEMPVVETIELHREITRQRSAHVAACFLNRVMPEPLSTSQRRLLGELAGAGADVTERIGEGIPGITEDLELSARVHRAGAVHAKRLRSELPVPVVDIPLVAMRTGLATTRAVAVAIAERTGAA